ncbi:MAG: Holliday junction branch migration protein RuvA [Candidatus Magasanikbacteria bacterium]
MISIISGKIISNSGAEVVVLTPGGVGYKIFVSPARSEMWKTGSEAQVLTYLAVHEDAMDLFGFSTEAERGLFIKLLAVSGIGPKTALRLLSLGSVEEIGSAINSGDVAYLTKVSGIGGKTAERIVVELRGKIDKLSMGDSGPLGDVVEGLIALGYSSAEAREAVKKIDTKGKTSEQILKTALQRIK